MAGDKYGSGAQAYALYQRIQMLLSVAEFSQGVEGDFLPDNLAAKTDIIKENQELLLALSEDLLKLIEAKAKMETAYEAGDFDKYRKIKTSVAGALDELFKEPNPALSEQLNEDNVLDNFRKAHFPIVNGDISVRSYTHIQGGISGIPLGNNGAFEYLGTSEHVELFQNVQNTLEQVDEYRGWVQYIGEHNDGSPFPILAIDKPATTANGSGIRTFKNGDNFLQLNIQNAGSVGFEPDSPLANDDARFVKERGRVFDTYQSSLLGITAHEVFHIFQWEQLVQVELETNPSLVREDIIIEPLGLKEIIPEAVDELVQKATENLDKIFYYVVHYNGKLTEPGFSDVRHNDQKIVDGLNEALQNTSNIRLVTRYGIEQQTARAEARIMECLCDLDLVSEYHQRGDYFYSFSRKQNDDIQLSKARIDELDEVYDYFIAQTTDPGEKALMENIFQDALILRDALYQGNLSDIDEVIERLKNGYSQELDEVYALKTPPSEFYSRIREVYKIAETFQHAADLQGNGEISVPTMPEIDVSEFRYTPALNSRDKGNGQNR